MATNDSSAYLVRFNEVSQILEYSVNGTWVAVPIAAIAPGSVTVAMLTSGAATIGQVLTADGSGGAAFA